MRMPSRLNRCLRRPVPAALLALTLAACGAAPKQESLRLPPASLAPGDRVAVTAVMPCHAGIGNPRTCTVDDPTRALAEMDLPGIEGVGLMFGSIARGAHEATAARIGALDHAPLLASAWTQPVASLLERNGYVAAVSEPAFTHTSALAEASKTAVRSSPIPSSYDGRVSSGNRLREPYHDFTAIAESAGAGHVLVLEVLRHGVDRWIGPFGIPSTAPYAVAAVRVSLEAPGDPVPLFNTYADATREVPDGDSEAQQDALAAAVEEALLEAIDEAHGRLVAALSRG